MDNKERLASLSIEDSESSYEESESVDALIDSLRISSSLDSCKDENEYIARGKPVMMKSHSEKPRSKKQTSPSVLQVMYPNVNSNKSSGYSSSISPSCENAVLNYNNNYENQINIVNNPITFNEYQAIDIITKRQTKLNLKKFFSQRIARKKSNLDQWIFDFGDTHLIKCCRRGQIDAVLDALKEINKHRQIHLINHENAAKETALSIATFQMNEVLINYLLENGANPQQQLNMRNNVLHIAADLENDKERKTFGYLINGISKYQEQNLITTLMSKNIFNYNPLQILQIHSQMNSDDPINRMNIEKQINHGNILINSYLKCVPYMEHGY